MSRIPIRISLDSANVPLLSYQSGPTVVYVKEGMAKLRQEVKATDAPWELTEPQLIFAENVMPIPRGLSSVTYSSKVAGINGATTFSKAGVYRTSTNAVDIGLSRQMASCILALSQVFPGLSVQCLGGLLDGR